VRFSSTALFYSKRVKDVEAFSGYTSWGCVSAIDSNGRTIWIADRIAAMKSVSLCERMKYRLRLSNSKRRFEPSLHKIKTDDRGDW
jgi:hypothetical protein